MRLLQAAFVIVFALAAAWAEPVEAGTYKGTWQGSSGAAGDFRITLSRTSEGQWKSDVVFGFNGQDVKCKVSSVLVDGAKLKVVYGFDLQGNALESMIDGELSGRKLAGTYKTQVPGDGTTVDEGTWSTTAER
jgi:hypothetical protein